MGSGVQLVPLLGLHTLRSFLSVTPQAPEAGPAGVVAEDTAAVDGAGGRHLPLVVRPTVVEAAEAATVADAAGEARHLGARASRRCLSKNLL